MTHWPCGARVFSDFFVRMTDKINDPGWVIEVLRDGDSQQRHAKRLKLGGKYAAIPRCGFCRIDFRAPGTSKLPRHQ